MPRILVNIYQLTRNNIPEGLKLNQHHSEILKPRDVVSGLHVTVFAVLLVRRFVSFVQYKYLYT
jgi:hypothetical protein